MTGLLYGGADVLNKDQMDAHQKALFLIIKKYKDVFGHDPVVLMPQKTNQQEISGKNP